MTHRANFHRAMNETIQENLKTYGEYPSSQFSHIERLKGRLFELDNEIEEIQQDRNRFLTKLCKARNISQGQIWMS